MEVEDIERGWTVFSEDGKRVGDVVEVHPHYLLVSRGLLLVRDLYVPRYAVNAVADRKVHLAISEERLRKIGWTSPPPPPPPPADSPAPRLVPPLQPDEYALPEQAVDDAGALSAADDGAMFSPADFGAGETYPSEIYFDDYEDMGVTFGPFVEVDGEAYLAVRRLAPPPPADPAPIVLIHGWGFDRRVWDYLTLELAGDYTVVTYDARGYGMSSAPWSGYDMDQASRDLRMLLRTLDLKDATLVGLDLGAAVALHYALSGGRRAGRLVLIAPLGVPAGEEATIQTEQVAGAWRDDLRRDRPRLATALAKIWAPSASADTRAWLRESVRQAGAHALLHGLDAFDSPDVGGALEDVAWPTVILHGHDDLVVPLSNGERIAAAIPAARLVVLESTGHLPMIADPARIAAEIRAAIEGTGEAPPESGGTSPVAADDAVTPDEAGSRFDTSGGANPPEPPVP